MTKTDETSGQSSLRPRVVGWAVAAFVAVLGAACTSGNGVTEPTQTTVPPDVETSTTVAPDGETLSDLEVIEAAVAAFYSGDAERAAELFELPDRTDDEIRAEAAYQAIIGGRLTLDCIESQQPIICTVPYHNAATDAVSYVDHGDRIEVTVEDGVITEFGFPEHSWFVIPFGIFLATEGRFEGYVDCGVGPFPESCATIQLENLDAWVQWRDNMDRAKVVEVALESWYGGDCEAALFLSGEPFHPYVNCSTSSSPGQTIEYESILGAQVSVENCEATSTNNLSCEVHYTSAMNSAVGKPPWVTVREFNVDNDFPFLGELEQDQPWYEGVYPEDTELRESFRMFAEGGELRDEYGDANCASARTPECANLILANLDSWAAWYETNG